MIGTMDTAALTGFNASKVRVEVHISRGLPLFQIVGLAENSVKEARVRVQSSITNAGFDFPRGRIFINLAPADVQKNGTCFDLAMAMAILQATGVVLPHKMKGIAAIGELALTGEIRPVRGMLALAESIREQGFSTLIVAKENGAEASLIQGLSVKVVATFAEMVSAIIGDGVAHLDDGSVSDTALVDHSSLDMHDVVGQEEAKRALLIAAAGDHNVVFVGGPGSGKSMMAHRLPTIMPPLGHEEALVLTKIYSVAGLTLAGRLITERPFRSPHHSTTRAGISGGGSKIIRPGEVSLACFGVLFLDELLEFPRCVLEMLRQPLEDGSITISRASHAVTFPARISLVGAFNPCPCGGFGQKRSMCTCSDLAIERYQSRLSGPLADRIDLFVDVPPVNLRTMDTSDIGESSMSMRHKVVSARKQQTLRLGESFTNGKMSRRQIKETAALKRDAHNFLLNCGDKLGLSARGYDRIIKVARTIADLDESKEIFDAHVGEALHFRRTVGLRKQRG